MELDIHYLFKYLQKVSTYTFSISFNTVDCSIVNASYVQNTVFSHYSLMVTGTCSYTPKLVELKTFFDGLTHSCFLVILSSKKNIFPLRQIETILLI